MNRATLAVLTLAAACLALAACGAASPSAGSKATVTVTASAAPAVTVTVTATPKAASKPPAPKPPAGPKVIARFNGSGDQSTPGFTTPASWHLSWEYNCSAVGTGNFIVNENNTDGSQDSNGVNVNELGAGRGPVATYAFGDADSHTLQVISGGCSWSLAIVTG